MFELKGHYFNNKFHPFGKANTKIGRVCPGDIDKTLWTMPLGSPPTNEIIGSAEKGFRNMRCLASEKKINLLKIFQKTVLKRKDEMAYAIAMETGKPLWESQGEVQAVAKKVDITIEHSFKRVENTTITDVMPKTHGYIYHKPLGICLVIGPFNFPCHLANTQILAALLAGNSIIFKPSEKAAYSGQILIECLHEAGFPIGTINLLQGTGEAAATIIQKPSVKGIFFTGSREVGYKIVQAASTDISKLVALELGGKNTAIVCNDASFEYTLQELLKAAFLTTGQRCVSVSNIAVQRSIFDKFVQYFHKLAQKIIVDHPIDYEMEPFMGPLIDQKGLEQFLKAVDSATKQGIETVMKTKEIEKRYRGYYVGPSIYIASKFNRDSHFLMEEVFGPCCTFIPFDHIDEAIEITNATEYGLAACVFSNERRVYEQCINEIDAGLINFNRSTCGASATLPFGGVKNSGNYRPAASFFIDSCVYQMSSLEVYDFSAEETIKGLRS